MEIKTQLSKSYLVVKWIAISMVVLQLLVKVYIEFPKVSELTLRLPVLETAWALTFAWAILIPLNTLNHKNSYLVGAILGILNGGLGILMPFSGMCNHYLAGIIVGLQGILISIFSYRTYQLYDQ